MQSYWPGGPFQAGMTWSVLSQIDKCVGSHLCEAFDSKSRVQRARRCAIATHLRLCFFPLVLSIYVITFSEVRSLDDLTMP